MAILPRAAGSNVSTLCPDTKDEKAQYTKEAFKGFELTLGNLHEESYIYAQDVRAASYGYGGKPQEYRYHQ